MKTPRLYYFFCASKKSHDKATDLVVLRTTAQGGKMPRIGWEAYFYATKEQVTKIKVELWHCKYELYRIRG